MSGLYNVMFGFNKLAGPLLAMLKVDPKTIQRFRDCFLSEDGSEIIIYTRTGGNNRQDHAESNERLRGVKGYVRDEDDRFDTTYALFHFAVPDDMASDCKELASRGWGVDPAKRWKETIDAIGKSQR